MTITSFRDLNAWKLSMDLTERIYAVTRLFPDDERFGLVAQLRRSVVGIPSNVSEGHQHGTRAYHRFVIIALGCLAECETQLEIARRLKLAPERQLQPALAEIVPLRKVLHGLARSLERRQEQDAE
jgi:four helix bundle protein